MPHLVTRLRWLLLGLLPLAAAVDRPNIILILTDDQGYADLACHGHPYLETPNLDRLHAQSTRFTDFHVSPTCSPTRSAILTGRYPFHNGVSHTILERERLALGITTLAEVLKRAGYTTAIFGKWHLGDEDAYQPDQRGFDEVFIHGAGGIGQAYPGSCADAPPNQKNRYFDPVIRHNGTFVKTKGYCTDVFFRQALAWIDSVKARPFFAYISTNTPHGPNICPESYSAPYLDKARDKSHAAFSGMITNIDDNIGTLMAKLEAWNLAENTLLIFMTDNGSAGSESSGGMKGRKGSVHEGGTRVPLFFRWTGHIEEGRDIDQLTRHVDLLPTLVELTHATPPEDIDGRSLVGLIDDGDAEWPDRQTFFHTGRWGKPGLDGRWGGDGAASGRDRSFAVRTERWRLVGRNELYDVQLDPGETTNVLDENPEVAQHLLAAYDHWWDRMQPYLVNEDVPLAEERPYYKHFAAQVAAGGIPVMKDR